MKKTLHWLDENLEEFLLVVMLAAMTLIMGIQIFSRYALGQSLSWSEEVTRFLFIWSGFLSVSYCSKKCLSIKIEQFVAAFPRRGKALFKVVNHTFELIFFLYMIPFAYSYMMSAIHSGQLSPACGIPMYYIQAAPFVSFLLVTFRILQRWIIEFKVARGEDVYTIRPTRSAIHQNPLSMQMQICRKRNPMKSNLSSRQIHHLERRNTDACCSLICYLCRAACHRDPGIDHARYRLGSPFRF